MAKHKFRRQTVIAHLRLICAQHLHYLLIHRVRFYDFVYYICPFARAVMGGDIDCYWNAIDFFVIHAVCGWSAALQ